MRISSVKTELISVSENSSLPVYTIEVGAAGQFNNDANIDISSTLNAELAAAPKGDQIQVVFNPGDYGVAHTILLPSNTTVIGNGAELGFMPGANGGSPNGSALISNAATYYIANNAYLENENGTYTEVPYTQVNTARVATTYSAIIMNTNISVSGLVFNETGSSTDGDAYTDVDGNTFGTWFTNATNIDVSDNLYIGGNDGNAFVNVQNGVVANNIAIGNLCAFDNWNGTSNVTIINNQVWQKSVGDNSAFAGVQINSSPNGNPVTGGDITNDAVAGDSFAGNTIWQSAVNSDPLLDHGSTTETQITEEGNVDTSLGGYTQGFYSSGPISNLEVSDNVVTGAVIPSTVEPGLIDAVGTGVKDTDISGNLLYGTSVATSSTDEILAAGLNVSVTDNASVLESIDGETTAIVTNASTGGQPANPTVPASAWIEVPGNIMTTNESQTIQGVSIENEPTNTPLTLTVTAQFGTISSTASGVSSENNLSDQNTLIFTGDADQINQELSTLLYTPTVGDDTDTIEFVVSDGAGIVTTSYVPIINETLLENTNNVVTIGAGFIANSDSYSANGATGDTATPPPLLGDILIATSGENILDMSSLVSQAYLGTGNNTVIGGSLDEYIAAGSGLACLDLTGGGNVTFVGSSGSSTINAISGSDLVEAGSGTTNVIQGNNAVSVIGGLGRLNYSGGANNTFITTLPENGGNLTAVLGTGNSTVEALSGNDVITTQEGTKNLIALGSGADSVDSSGDDLIYAGEGTDTINITTDSVGSVVGGGGTIVLVDGGLSVAFSGSEHMLLPLTGLAIALSSDTINFRTGEMYDSSSREILLNNQLLNMVGNDQALIYAANQDTVNVNGAQNLLILAPNGAIPPANPQATIQGGSSTIEVDGSSMALIETGYNSILGANGAQLIVGGGDNTITGQDLQVQLSGAGNEVVLTGVDTVSATSPYSYESTNMPITIQNEMTVESGQFALGGLDSLDQASGSALISLFGGNKVTLNGSGDSVVASDQIYGGNILTNDGSGNSITVVNTQEAATTITANTSTLVSSIDNKGTVIGGTNNNSNENLTFIAGSGTSNTILGAASNASITLFGGQSFGNIVYGGKDGGNVFNGGAGGADYFVGGGNGDILIGGAAGQNTLVAGVGAETLIGAEQGNDIFSIPGGGGFDVIQNFTGSLNINPTLSVTSETNVAGSLMVTLSDSTRIMFAGVANFTQIANTLFPN